MQRQDGALRSTTDLEGYSWLVYLSDHAAIQCPSSTWVGTRLSLSNCEGVSFLRPLGTLTDRQDCPVFRPSGIRSFDPAGGSDIHLPGSQRWLAGRRGFPAHRKSGLHLITRPALSLRGGGHSFAGQDTRCPSRKAELSCPMEMWQDYEHAEVVLYNSGL